MTYFDNQATIKALRDSGVPGTPALNSKAVVLQAWIDSYNRKQATAVEEVPAVQEVTYPKGVDPYTGFSTSYEPPMDSYEQNRVNVLENCVNVTYYSNGVVQNVNKETLYCELPQTLSNFQGIDQVTMQATEWQTATPLTCDICNYQVCQLPPRKLTLSEIMARPDIEPTPAQQRELDQLEELYGYVPVPAPVPVPINHGELGIALVLITLEAWRLVAFLLIPLIAQTFYA